MPTQKKINDNLEELKVFQLYALSSSIPENADTLGGGKSLVSTQHNPAGFSSKAFNRDNPHLFRGT